MTTTRQIGQACAAGLGVALIASMTACSGGPVTPDRAAPATGGSSVANAGAGALSTLDATAISLRGADARNQVSFPLTDGSFTITSKNGNISGAYLGFATVPVHGRGDATLSLDVTGGTGDFAGAAGNLTGDGNGDFTGAGRFTLSLRGSIVTTANRKGLRVQGTISGNTSLSCVEPSLFAALNGDGPLGAFGKAQAVLTHLIGNAVCIS